MDMKREGRGGFSESSSGHFRGFTDAVGQKRPCISDGASEGDSEASWRLFVFAVDGNDRGAWTGNGGQKWQKEVTNRGRK